MRLKEIQECPICLVEFIPDQHIYRLGCSPNHMFHQDCLDELIKVEKARNGGAKGKCPLCRKDIDEAKLTKVTYKGLEDAIELADIDPLDFEDPFGRTILDNDGSGGIKSQLSIKTKP